MEPKTILCICTSGVGNAIMFTPVITNIRLYYPYSRIFFMGSPASVQVVKGSEFVDDVIEYKIERRWRALFEVRKLKPDWVVVAFSDRGIFLSFLSWFSGAIVRAGFVYKNKGLFYNRPLFVDNFFEKHEVQHNLDLCRVLDVPIITGKTFFAVDEKDEKFADDWMRERGLFGKAIIGLHPGSSPRYFQKRWNAQRYGELSSVLVRRGFSILVFGGAEEVNLFEQISSKEPAVVSAIGIGFKRSAALIKRCVGFVSNDSGFMHIAYTLGVPTLALFGPTSENRSGPLGVSSIVTAPVSCRPCYRGQKRIECEHVSCMRNITVDNVANEFFRLLDRAKSLREQDEQRQFNKG